jgi:hypothetical protein
MQGIPLMHQLSQDQIALLNQVRMYPNLAVQQFVCIKPEGIPF